MTAVTGARGYVGAALCDALSRSGHRVRRLTRDPDAARGDASFSLADGLSDGALAGVDTLIHAANAQCDDATRTKVSAAMLFAAARFNTFVVAAAAASGEDLASRRDEIVAWLTSQYTAMLRDNLDEYARRFDRYVPRP